MSRKGTRAFGVALAIGALAAASAGCGSSNSGSNGGSAAGGSNGGGTNIARYQAVVRQAMQGPTKWDGPTKPVTPPKNVKLAIVECAGVLEGCSDPANAAARAAKDLGWSATVYDGKGDPATQNKVIEQAISGGANAVLTFSIDPSFIKGALTTAHSKHIPVGSSAQGVAASPTGFAFDVGANWSEVGRLQGNWVVADSKGTADFLPMIDKEYASVVASAKAAENVVRSCSGCTVEDEQSFVGANVGNGLGQRVVGQLRAHPKIDYVLGTYDPAAADIATAIANSGLGSDRKLIGQIGLHQNFDLIRQGRGQTADVAFDQVYTGYATVDQLIRLMTHKPLFVSEKTKDPRFKYGENVPIKLITKANVPPPGANYEAPIGTVQHFHQLWGL